MELSSVAPEFLVKAWEYTENWQWVEGETPLSDWYSPVIGMIAYLFIIFVLHAFMKNRDPITIGIRPLLVLHNLILCVYSGLSVTIVLYEVYRYQTYGDQNGNPVSLFDLFCDSNQEFSRGRLYFMTYLFYLSKYYELVDTIFIVLKKRSLTLLHVYHHCIMMPVCWAGFYTNTTYQWMGCLTNTFVHTIMYYYYAMTALQYRSWWKQYVTQLQLFQFLTNLTVLFLWTYFNFTIGCAGEWFSWAIVVTANITFFFLFLHFYYKEYNRSAAAAGAGRTRPNPPKNERKSQ